MVAVIDGDAPRSNAKPAAAAAVDARRTATQSPRMYPVLRPEAFIPDDADRDSGMFERKTAATTATPTPPPLMRLTPIAADSGMPSSSAPSTRAAAPAPSWGPFGLLRRC